MTPGYPSGGLVADASGNLYGTGSYGGDQEVGDVFKVAAGTGVITTIASFNTTNGAYPQAGVIIDAEGQGEDARVQVNFGAAGVKWLAVAVAKLQAA